MSRPFEIGDRLHGFCKGYFGRDSYVCRTVEVVGPDYIVTRNDDGYIELASRFGTLKALVQERDNPDNSYCECMDEPPESFYWTG